MNSKPKLQPEAILGLPRNRTLSSKHVLFLLHLNITSDILDLLLSHRQRLLLAGLPLLCLLDSGELPNVGQKLGFTRNVLSEYFRDDKTILGLVVL